MGVPGWLLNIIMGFLSERVLQLNYKGNIAKDRSLPGGGPQGTILGLLLFLILINFCGFEKVESEIGETITNQRARFLPKTFHAKYVDDLTIAESLNLKEALTPNPDRMLPDNYHARMGQKLSCGKSQVYSQISKVEQYALDNEMKINSDKSTFILFNPTKTFDFIPDCEINGKKIDTNEEIKILGLTLQNDLKWKSNTNNMTRKAYKRLWIIKRLKKAGANKEDLIDVYTKQVRSVVEFGVPVWNSGLSKEEV